MVHDLLTHPEVTDEMLASIDAIGVGGADMPDAFRRLYERRFGRRVGTGYGLTEAPTASRRRTCPNRRSRAPAVGPFPR
jgi:acyl-CoA synthetase (AMP-forming)/AMP-acid ligase II